ncbi:MAG: D-alanine--D-alanine ligase family protein [Planctomycetota bacterium]
MNSRLKVGVLMGGIGTERDISIQSGQCVAEALREASFDVVTADIRPDNLDILEDSSVNVFFPALHGKFGEDGQLQQVLEDQSLVYTGSGPAASALAFDKMASKKIFARAGIATPAAVEFKHDTDIQQLVKKLQPLGDRYVIKPVREGSSIGVSSAAGVEDAIIAARKTLCRFGDCMIEQFVPGREVTVGVLCDKPLPVIEIKSRNSFYDYQAKYVDEQTEYLFDTIEDEEVTAQILSAAMSCFDLLGCRHFARVDLILDADNRPHVLEVNTIPGFTTHSLLPKAAGKVGLSMSDLCVKIVEAALAKTK